MEAIQSEFVLPTWTPTWATKLIPFLRKNRDDRYYGTDKSHGSSEEAACIGPSKVTTVGQIKAVREPILPINRRGGLAVENSYDMPPHEDITEDEVEQSYDTDEILDLSGEDDKETDAYGDDEEDSNDGAYDGAYGELIRCSKQVEERGKPISTANEAVAYLNEEGRYTVSNERKLSEQIADLDWEYCREINWAKGKLIVNQANSVVFLRDYFSSLEEVTSLLCKRTEIHTGEYDWKAYYLKTTLRSLSVEMEKQFESLLNKTLVTHELISTYSIETEQFLSSRDKKEKDIQELKDFAEAWGEYVQGKTMDNAHVDKAFETHSLEEILQEKENLIQYTPTTTDTQPDSDSGQYYAGLFKRKEEANSNKDDTDVSPADDDDQLVPDTSGVKGNEIQAESSAPPEVIPTETDEKIKFVNGLYSLYCIDPALTEKMELELGAYILSALKSDYKILQWEDVVEKMKKDYKEIAGNKHEVIANKVLLELRLSDQVVLRYYPKIKKVVIGFESWLRKSVQDKTNAFCKPYLRVSFPHYAQSAGLVAENRFTTWKTRI